ncbi:hypothetical protein QFC21_005510 [Naganishia friedmannii]|uniref:Uncharacterized protein n=1 Tax=Naganishia friedmannii TaxID=89922 RepID=A0ACC2V948_9TREE|nr:hypothetical protein QFC21_005510 [Naganishia friedmannii]
MKKRQGHTGEGGSTKASKRGGNAGVRGDTPPSDVEMLDGSNEKGEERTVGEEPGSATAFSDASAPNEAAPSDLFAQLRALTMGNSGFETSAAAGSVPPSSQRKFT